MSLLPFLAWLLGFSGLARAECPADVAHFRVHVDAAQAAYGGFDVPGFQQEAGELEAEVACLSGVPAPATIIVNHALAQQLGLDLEPLGSIGRPPGGS